MGQRIGQVHSHPAKPVLGCRLDHLLAQGGQRHGNLDRGARLESRTERHLLVHHGEHPPGDGIHHYDRSVVLSQRIHCRAADVEVFAVDVVAVGRIGISRAGPRATGNDRTARPPRAAVPRWPPSAPGTVVTRTGVREATEHRLRPVSLPAAGRFASAVLCAAFTRRCLRLGGTVPRKASCSKEMDGQNESDNAGCSG